MSDTQPKWTSTISFLLTNPAGTHLLLRPGPTGYQLPSLTAEGLPMWGKLNQLEASIAQELGLQAWLLRRVYYQEREAAYQAEGIYVLESKTAPAGLLGQWMPLETIPALPLSDENYRPALADYIHELQTGHIPAQRPAWSRPGWLPGTVAWIDEQLTNLGMSRVGEVEVLKRWSLSCILRVPIPAGDYYFKATVDMPLFVNEAILTQELARRYPKAVVRPVAIDPQKQWMLLPDFGPVIGWKAPAGAQEAMLRAFAQLQLQAAHDSNALLEIGCLDRRLPQLSAQIEPLFQQISQSNLLSPEMTNQLWQRAERLKAICQELNHYHIPNTLAHGDLHLGNVAGRPEQPTFFDWTDACLTHPFIDLLTLHRAKPPETKIYLRDIYLAFWTEFEPMERLQEAWNLAQPLCYLHQLVSYFYIIINLEPASRDDLLGAIPDWSKKLIEVVPLDE